jgi:hypothetical protein
MSGRFAVAVVVGTLQDACVAEHASAFAFCCEPSQLRAL